MLYLIRNLSNVNTQVRKDLGDAFWSIVSVDCQDVRHIKALEHFINDRPAACHAIKRLTLGVGEFINPLLPTLPQLCSKLQLEEFQLTLYVDKATLMDLLDGRGKAGWLVEVFRHIPVFKSFHLNLIINHSNDNAFEMYSKQWLEEKHTLKKQHSPTIKALLLPNTLRALPVLSAQDQYLLSRSIS